MTTTLTKTSPATPEQLIDQQHTLDRNGPVAAAFARLAPSGDSNPEPTVAAPPVEDPYAVQRAEAAKAEAEAEALRIKNEDARRRAAVAAQKADAKAQTEIQESLEAAADARREREAERRAAAEAKAKAERSAQQWKRAAQAIAAVCIVVSLPLQIMAFWDPHAWFLVAAPFVLEGVAWALLVGAAAAIDEGRASWHYRLGALLQALVAAGINYAHGSAEYGAATGIGGALCSLIGPMIWDLHEHGRIAKRDGRKSRTERRAEKRAAAAKRLRDRTVAAARKEQDSEVWDRALYLAAALGEIEPKSVRRLRSAPAGEILPTEKTYRRAWDEIHGTEVGSTAASIQSRRVARRSVRLAQNGPLEKGATGAESDEKAQVDSQMTPDEDEPAHPRSKPLKKAGEDGRKRNGGTPPRRRPGTSYTPGARRQMSVEASRRTDTSAA